MYIYIRGWCCGAGLRVHNINGFKIRRNTMNEQKRKRDDVELISMYTDKV